MSDPLQQPDRPPPLFAGIPTSTSTIAGGLCSWDRICSDSGSITIDHQAYFGFPLEPTGQRRVEWETYALASDEHLVVWAKPEDRLQFELLGFGFEYHHEPLLRVRPVEVIESVWSLRFPHAFAAMLFGLIPAGQGLGLWHRWLRRKHGQCIRCGYDLRATPAADGPKLDRCPECGTPTLPSSL